MTDVKTTRAPLPVCVSPIGNLNLDTVIAVLMVANRAPGDGHHETAIMLDSRSSSGRETEPQLDWASDTRKNQRRNRRQLTWSCFLTLCCLSTLALAGLFFFRLSREQAQLPRPEHHEINTGASIISSIAAPSQTQSHEDENKPETALVSSDQLDLKTGFIISEKPTIRDYVFNITRELAAPDGFQKSMILVNGQSPGPLIEANTGDVIRVIVNNKMPEASTTIHWHGIDQRNTVWMDGVHGVTQCGIPPGESFTYEFNVTDQRGTFWYHSHSSVQYTDGLYGPIVRYSYP